MVGRAARAGSVCVGIVMAFTGGVAGSAVADDQQTPVVAPGDGLNKLQPPDLYNAVRIEGEASTADGSTSVLLSKVGVGNPATGMVYEDDFTVSQQTSTASSSYACVKKTEPDSNLIAFVPAKVDVSNTSWEVHYVNHMYAMHRARYVNGGYTTQFEMCAIGGSRNKRTFQRMARTESEMAVAHSENRRIGSNWGTKVDSGKVSSSLSFSVSLAKAVSISGSLPVSSGGEQVGGIGDGLCGGLGPNSGNQVNGGWDYDYPGYGTNDFKGNVAHGLYEFYKPSKDKFYYYFQACYQARY